MINEYAIDPAVLLAWASNDRDYAEFQREYGLGTPRIFSSFPVGKAAKLRSYFLRKSPAAVDSLQGRRYVEMVTKLAEVVVLRQIPEAQTHDWGVLVEREHERLPFDVIISSVALNTGRTITPDNMYAQGSIWNHPDQLNIQRTNEGFCAAVVSLLRLATQQIVVIDSYGWTPEAIVQVQHLIRCISEGRVNTVIPRMTLFFKKNQRSPNAAHVKNEILRGVNLNGTVIQINVLELEEIPGNDIIHNRYILTEHGGVTVGHGIGVSGDPAHTDDAVLLKLNLYHKKWKQFVEDQRFSVVSQA